MTNDPSLWIYGVIVLTIWYILPFFVFGVIASVTGYSGYCFFRAIRLRRFKRSVLPAFLLLCLAGAGVVNVAMYKTYEKASLIPTIVDTPGRSRVRFCLASSIHARVDYLCPSTAMRVPDGGSSFKQQWFWEGKTLSLSTSREGIVAFGIYPKRLFGEGSATVFRVTMPSIDVEVARCYLKDPPNPRWASLINVGYQYYFSKTLAAHQSCVRTVWSNGRIWLADR